MSRFIRTKHSPIKARFILCCGWYSPFSANAGCWWKHTKQSEGTKVKLPVSRWDNADQCVDTKYGEFAQTWGKTSEYSDYCLPSLYSAALICSSGSSAQMPAYQQLQHAAPWAKFLLGFSFSRDCQQYPNIRQIWKGNDMSCISCPTRPSPIKLFMIRLLRSREACKKVAGIQVDFFTCLSVC